MEEDMGKLPDIGLFCRQIVRLPENLYRYWHQPRFKLGDIYLDCSWTPCVVTEAETYGLSWAGPWDQDLSGISLLDGSYGHGCSAFHCAPERLEYPVAEHIVSLMLGTDQDLVSVLERREAGIKNIERIYRQSPELQRL
jgi:hypothetical protein